MPISLREVRVARNQRVLLLRGYIMFLWLYINGYSKLTEHVPGFKFPKLFLIHIIYIWTYHLSTKNCPLSSFYILK